MPEPQRHCSDPAAQNRFLMPISAGPRVHGPQPLFKSDRARRVVAALSARGVAVRPLGDVVCLMASPTAVAATRTAAVTCLLDALDHTGTDERPARPCGVLGDNGDC